MSLKKLITMVNVLANLDIISIHFYINLFFIFFTENAEVKVDTKVTITMKIDSPPDSAVNSSNGKIFII